MKKGRLDEKISECRYALEKDPTDLSALTGLASLLLLLNDVEGAIDHFQKAIELKPDLKGVHSDLLMCTNYLSTYTNQDRLGMHQLWAQLHAPISSVKAVDKYRRETKLKIGLLSGDFCHHVVPNFLFPWLENANRNKLEFYAFSEAEKKSNTSYRLAVHFSGWFDTYYVSDQEVAKKIEEQGVDILIDLAGHTKANRLSVMAYRAAPVQVSYLGYVNTTGLEQVDYRIIDVHVNPPETQQFYSEELAYLPASYTCYSPPKNAPSVSPLPFNENGYITFGCFNNANKITKDVVEVWSDILHRLPDSKLKLKSKSFDIPEASRLLEDWFLTQSITPDRIVYEGSSNYPDYFEAYNSIDIALDSFPYNGGTVTHDTLYMGVPVIVLEGDNYVSRMGVSILNNLGYPDWIGKDKDEYIDKAIDLSKDIERLQRIRNRIRSEMLNSPLCDGPSFATSMETLLFEIWNKNQPNQ